MIALSNLQFASCSFDCTIKIWSIEKYTQIPIAILHGHKSKISSLLYIKNQNFLISCAWDKTLRVWSLLTYQCVSVFKAERCFIIHCFDVIDDNVIAGGEEEMFVVNIKRGKIEEVYQLEKFHSVNSVMRLRDGNLLFACGTREFIIYDKKNKKFTKIETDDLHSNIIAIDKETFASGYDNIHINIWKY